MIKRLRKKCTKVHSFRRNQILGSLEAILVDTTKPKLLLNHTTKFFFKELFYTVAFDREHLRVCLKCEITAAFTRTKRNYQKYKPVPCFSVISFFTEILYFCFVMFVCFQFLRQFYHVVQCSFELLMIPRLNFSNAGLANLSTTPFFILFYPVLLLHDK